MKKLEIQPVGNPEYPRFLIANDQGEVFDGTSFTKDWNQATIFNKGQAVALQYNALQEAMCKDWPIREFTVPLNIRVRSGSSFSKKELEEYLERATSIFLDFEKGTGPVENSMVQLAVTWREMKEKAPAEAEGKR